MRSTGRVEELVRAADAYRADVSGFYDEVVDEVADRAAETGSLGKLELGALSAWKRLRADTPWMTRLMSWPDPEVRRHTERAIAAANDESLAAPGAAAAARSALSPLPGFAHGDAMASVVCYAAAPLRLAIYDRRAHAGLRQLGLDLDDQPGRYSRYISLIEQCQRELAEKGLNWTPRQVDLALYQLGQ